MMRAYVALVTIPIFKMLLYNSKELCTKSSQILSSGVLEGQLLLGFLNFPLPLLRPQLVDFSSFMTIMTADEVVRVLLAVAQKFEFWKTFSDGSEIGWKAVFTVAIPACPTSKHMSVTVPRRRGTNKE